MNAIAQVIGWVFLVAALIGAVIPGMNFHVLFVDDEAAIRLHQKKAKEVQKRWEKKHDKAWKDEE